MADLSKHTSKLTDDDRLNVMWFELFGKSTDSERNGVKGDVLQLKKQMKSKEEMTKFVSEIAKDKAIQASAYEVAKLIKTEREKLKKIVSNVWKLLAGFCTVLLPAYIMVLNYFLGK